MKIALFNRLISGLKSGSEFMSLNYYLCFLVIVLTLGRVAGYLTLNVNPSGLLTALLTTYSIFASV